jgi:hypothetical protein
VRATPGRLARAPLSEKTWRARATTP